MSQPPQAPPPPPPPPPPAGGQPPIGQPAYGAPGGPTPPRGGFPGWAVGAIIGAVLLVGGGVTYFALSGDEDTPAQVLPTGFVETPSAAPSTEAVTPLPTSTATTEVLEETPTQLIDLVPTMVQQFELTSWDNAPQFRSTFHANNAIEAEFNRSDGKQILHYLFGYNTNTEARIEKDAYVDAFEAIGFVTVAEERSRGVDVTRLAREEEVLVWSNGPLMAVVEGPFDVTTGFFLELEY